MARTLQYRQSLYSIGGDIFVRFPAGWNKWCARRFFVDKITPSGQIVASANGESIRISARGRVIGTDRASAISQDEALEIQKERRFDSAWLLIRDAGNQIERAARKQCDEALELGMSALMEAVNSYRSISKTELPE